MKKYIFVAAAASAALVLSACSGGSPQVTPTGAPPTTGVEEPGFIIDGETIASAELYAAAQAEGSMVLYDSFPEAQWRAVLDVFTEDTGVEVEHIRVVTAQLYERAVSEAGAGRLPADAIGLGDIILMEDMAERGILAQYESPMATSALTPDQYDPDHYWYTASQNGIALAYNEAVVDPADVPKSWDDLLDPKWDGKIGFTPITIGGSAFSSFYLLKEIGGVEYWEGLAANNPRKYESVVPMTQDIVRGEIPLGITSPSVVAAQRAGGAPINTVFFKEGTAAFANLVSVVEEASSPNAARLYVEWLLSERGQKTVSEVGGEFPARTDIAHVFEGAIVPAGGMNVVIPPLEVWMDQRDQLIEEWNTIFNE